MSTTWFFDSELSQLRHAWAKAVAEHARHPSPAALDRAHAAFDRYFEAAEQARVTPSDAFPPQKVVGEE